MKLIKINETKKINGENNLYYQIEFYDVKNGTISLNESNFSTVTFPRKISRALHNTGVFKDIGKVENKSISDNLCKEYRDKLIKTINKLIEINAIR